MCAQPVILTLRPDIIITSRHCCLSCIAVWVIQQMVQTELEDISDIKARRECQCSHCCPAERKSGHHFMITLVIAAVIAASVIRVVMSTSLLSGTGTVAVIGLPPSRKAFLIFHVSQTIQGCLDSICHLSALLGDSYQEHHSKCCGYCLLPQSFLIRKRPVSLPLIPFSLKSKPKVAHCAMFYTLCNLLSGS